MFVHKSPLPSVQTDFVLQGALEVTGSTQNSRLGSSLAEIQDMNGDGFRELVVGAPLEDDHQGAVYVFYGRGRTVQGRYRQVAGGTEPSEEKRPHKSGFSSTAGGCSRLSRRSQVLWPKSSRRPGRQRRRAGGPGSGSTGSRRHHLVGPQSADGSG